ncbi:MAG TPA: zf-HC2 domain-containing protein [Candidatus Binatia bacterium]
MNECERLQESLGGWLDGELSSAESERVRAHVESCAACRAARQRFEKLDSVLNGVLVAEAGRVEFTPFWRAVERRISERRPRRPEWLDRLLRVPRTAWAVPAVIALLLALLSFDSYLPGWRWGATRGSFAAVDSIDAHGRSVALLRENETKTTVIWLYEDQEGEHETAEEAAQSGPVF